jgi:hypothetical protein
MVNSQRIVARLANRRIGLRAAADLLPFAPLRDSGEDTVGAWRSLVAHLLWEQRVGGSNPSAPTNFVEMSLETLI